MQTGWLSYYAGVAWCADAESHVVVVDRAALRHKRDNKLRTTGTGTATRLRADLAHLALHRVPAVEASRHVVGFAKHLCGVATGTYSCARSSTVHTDEQR